jgi:uncharacterized SAM-binding protein YcdF (DUF218 family)
VLSLGGLGALGGFFDFKSSLPNIDAGTPTDVDGIVALTGGDERIRGALELLRNHHGKRILVTGEPSSTSLSGLSSRIKGFEDLVGCCVDLDHAATNTAGNALAARQWANQRRFRSLIVVTSPYHMPRTMAEFRYQLRDVALFAAPVGTDVSFKSMVIEYAKFLLAHLRIGIGHLIGVLSPASFKDADHGPDAADSARPRDTE